MLSNFHPRISSHRLLLVSIENISLRSAPPFPYSLSCPPFFHLQAAHRLIASWLRVCNRRNDRKQLLRYCASARPSPSSFSSFSIRFSFHRKENSKRVSGNGSRAVGKGDGFRDVSKLSTFRIINSRSFSTRSSKVNWFPARVPAIGKSLFRCCFRVRKQSFFSIDPLDRAVSPRPRERSPDSWGKKAREISPTISSRILTFPTGAVPYGANKSEECL